MDTKSRALRALTLLVTSLGSFMVLLDGSIIFVALPEIQKSLSSEMSSLQWTVDAYTLPFAALMLTAGVLGDRIGRKKVFLGGLVLFIIGSAFCGFAGSLTPLIVGRVIQGIGAGAILTGSLALLVSTFSDPPGRAKAIGLWTAVSGVSIALGPLVGGVLINAFSWSAIFLVNLPIGVVALILGSSRLKESRNPQASSIDLPGQVLVAAGLTCLVMGLIRAEADGWTSGLILSLLIGSAVLLASFLVLETRTAEPMLPLTLFRNPTFAAACAIASILGFVIVGAMFFSSQYFMAVQGHSALEAGARLLPLTLGIFFLSPPASKIAGKRGPRIPVMVGALVTTVGFLLMATISVDSSFGSVWWKLLLVGAGIGLMFAPLTVAVMATVPPQRAGLGSSMINTTRITGFTAGAAVLGTIVIQQFTSRIDDALQARGVPASTSHTVAEAISSGGAYAGTQSGAQQLPISPSELQSTLHASFVDAVHVAFYICAAATLVAAAIAGAVMARGRLAPPAPPMGQPGQAGTPSSAGSDTRPAAEGATVRSESALVEADWLAPHLGHPRLVVIDCTTLVRPKPEGGVDLESGRTGYEEGHIPGAVFADLLTDFSDPEAKRPFALPDAPRIAAALERLGVNDGDTVVVYDRANASFAARMWWILRSIGFTNVSVLNGGWRKWSAEGLPSETGTASRPHGHVTAHANSDLFAEADAVLDAAGETDVRLVNALSPEQFEGSIPVAQGRRGHIPSSVNIPASSLIDPASGAFLPLSVIAERVERVGISKGDKVIAYCAAGPNATSVAFVLRLLGLNRVAVYDAGLVEWSADPSRPLVVTA